jgi:hypothetical protein
MVNVIYICIFMLYPLIVITKRFILLWHEIIMFVWILWCFFLTNNEHIQSELPTAVAKEILIAQSAAATVSTVGIFWRLLWSRLINRRGMKKKLQKKWKRYKNMKNRKKKTNGWVLPMHCRTLYERRNKLWKC